MSRIKFGDRIFKFEELSEDELIEVLELHPHAYCSAWESDFCESLVSRLHNGIPLTDRQIEILEKGLLKRLQENDPLLWGLSREKDD